MTHKSLFIFDVDGTLVDSYGAIERSLNFVRKSLGYSPVSMRRVKSNVGKGDKPFVEVFFPAEQADEALALYRKHHEKALPRYAKLYPHTRRVLAYLGKKNKILAIASNRPAYFTGILLRRLDIKKYFQAVYCGDELNSYKPKPKILQVILKRFAVARADAVYVGDMALDIETAKRARIEAVFKKGGSGSLAEIKQYKEKKVISSLDELLKIYN